MEMTLKDRNERCGGFFQRCMGILHRKGEDYQINNDAMREITHLAETLHVRPEQVLWVYAYKHLAAIQNYMQHGNLKSEDIQERLADVANYCALMAVCIGYVELAEPTKYQGS